MTDNYSTIRDDLVKEIEYEIVGPKNPNETLDKSPIKTYLSGALYPKQSFLDDEEEEKDHTEINGEDKSEIDEIVGTNISTTPSSMGITCNVSTNCAELNLEISYGRYEIVQGRDEEYKKWQRIPQPIQNKKIILKETNEELELDDHLGLKYNIKRFQNYFIVSIFLINNLIHNGKKVPPQKCIFQPKMKLQSSNPQDRIFLSIDTQDSSTENFEDVEDKTFELLFREKKQFAIGHSCAIKWDINDIQNNSVKWLETTFIPAYEAPLIIPNDEFEEFDVLDMYKLSQISNFDDYRKLLSPIESKYKDWINSLVEKKRELDSKFHDVAQYQIDQCNEALSRIHAGIELVSKNESGEGEAFRFTNKAMLFQRSYNDWARENIRNDGKILEFKPKLKGKWRLFQLAFILLTIESISKPTPENRQIADLLWFPTGGGKTEAYLGIIAFTLALRRIRKPEPARFGVTAIMRYTLRLLTIQQLQRAASLICACEKIREEEHSEKDPSKKKWGSKPFLVGLWVGSKTTPNRLGTNVTDENTAYAALAKLRENPDSVTEGNPCQLKSCPWCGTKLIPKNYSIGGEIRKLRIFCPNDHCDFCYARNKNGLPVLLIDEDIYKLCPSLIIGTVDKFAQISWNRETSSIFGKVNKYCDAHGFIQSNDPETHLRHQDGTKIVSFEKFGIVDLDPPELIIQDELHLIAGSLGTLTGLYETAIDLLCTKNEIPPKIIASTATTKNAEKQIQSLFNRNVVRIFPPQGFEFGNSFFAKEVKITKETRGRLYLGVCATARSGLTILARISATVLHKIRSLENEIDLTVLDQYYTLISYFNSIRELGGANRVFEDSVPDFMKRITKLEQRESPDTQTSNDQDEKSKKGKVKPYLYKEELTGRVNSADIPEILKKLEVPFGDSKRRAIDVTLCTNMIQVGVDIDRFGVMIINGQPKNTSEYIQASGRIGRRHPGLIITSYNYLKPRDLSHYENFLYYHSSFYRNVEPVSITPFAPRARDRGLFGVIVALVRILEKELADNQLAGKFSTTNIRYRELLARITSLIEKRVSNIDEEEKSGTLDDLKNHFDDWHKLAHAHPSLVYKKNPHPFASQNIEYYLMRTVGDYNDNAKPVPSSLRDAEEDTPLWYVQSRESENGEDQYE